MMQSRKWGVYCIANLQFKTYFKVNGIRNYAIPTSTYKHTA